MRRNRQRILGILMAVSVCALTACQGSGQGEDAAKEAAGAVSEEAGQTNPGGVVTYGLTEAWDSLNPYGSSSGSIYQQLVSDKLYDRLAFIEDAGTAVTPRGAKAWESSEDGRKAVFHLDEKARWHDGELVTAGDWEFTAGLVTNPDFDFGMKSEFNTWAGTTDAGVAESEGSVQVKALDDYTLEMTFKSPVPVEDWLKLHNKYFYVLPEHLLKDTAPADIKTSDFWKSPVGSGPCTFISEVAGNTLELGSFAEYQLGAPQFGKLVLQVMDATNTITSISTGELDGFYQYPSVDDAMAAKELGLQVTESDTPTNVVIFLINNQNVSDKRVR